jgi:hypothetical protein
MKTKKVKNNKERRRYFLGFFYSNMFPKKYILILIFRTLKIWNIIFWEKTQIERGRRGIPEEQWERSPIQSESPEQSPLNSEREREREREFPILHREREREREYVDLTVTLGPPCVSKYFFSTIL